MSPRLMSLVCGAPRLSLVMVIALDSERELIVQAANLMGRYLSAKETNTRYMALEAMCNLTAVEFARDSIDKHLQTVVQALKVRTYMGHLVGDGVGGLMRTLFAV